MSQSIDMDKERNKPFDASHNKKNITGQRFDRLVAMYPTERRDSRGAVIWHCRCDCGNETDVSYSSLLYGTYSSCGCLRKELGTQVSKKLTWIDHTALEWLEKRKYRTDNTSGFRGVVQRKNGSYQVNIGFQQKRYYLGIYKTYEEAVEARLAAEDLIHGGFLRACRKRNIQQGEANAGSPPDFVFQVHKTPGQISIISSDAEENGKTMLIGH